MSGKVDLEKYVSDEKQPRVEKVVKKPEETTPLRMIHETLKQLQEQIDQIPVADLTPIQQQLDDIKSSIGTLITLMEKKVETDGLEADVLKLLKAKMEKGS